MNGGNAQAGRTKTHNVRFYNLTPRSIQSMAHNKLWHKLAISRNDGSIEIWDTQHASYLEKVIPKSPGNSVEGMIWAGERLFSVGLTGELVEWDLLLLKPRRKQFVTGNAIWCVDINSTGTELAVGTEEGYINIFDIDNDQMQYKQLFDKQEGRVLCCKFDRTGEFLVTGSLGAIRIWDVKSGHALHKMTVSRAEKKKEVIVWSLQVLSDFTIISGDSRGQVSVWDGKLATHLESHQVLKADVLAVAVNEEENLLMCSGIEPIIRIYAKTKIKREDMEYYCWVKYLQRSVHDNDVKALVCAGDRIFSGGMDGYLGISSASKRSSTISKYGPFLKNPCVAVSTKNRLLLLRYTNYFEVWKLGSTDGRPQLVAPTEDENENENENENEESKHESKEPERRMLALDSAPEKLLEFKSKNDEPIICATISPDSQWLCYSTQKSIRLFRFLPAVSGEHATQLARVKGLPEQFVTASHIIFSSDSKRLFLVHPTTLQIHIFSIVNNGSTELDFVESIETSKQIKDVINLFAVSECGTYIVVAGADRTIAVWSLFQGKHFKHHLNMPRYSAITTALAIHANAPRLVAAFSDGKIIEYDLEEMCFTCSEREYFVENAATHCVSNVLLDSRNSKNIVLHNDAYLYVLEKVANTNGETEHDNEDAEATGKQVGKKLKRVVSDNKVSGLRLKFKKSYEHLISLCWLSTDELVAVGVNPVTLIEQLPDAFKQKKFGAA